MRIIHQFHRQLAAGAVLIGLFGWSIAAGAEEVPQVIKVIEVKGLARYSSDNKTWHSLKRGDILQAATLIQTAQKSSVDLQLGNLDAAPTSIDAPDGSVYTPEQLKANTVRLYENSVLDIGKLTTDRAAAGEMSETQLDLRAGRIMGAVRKSSAASRYEIKFLKGVAGVRDSVYLMNASGAMDVLYGTAIVALGAADGSTPVKIVTANHQFDPGTGLVTEIRSPLVVEPENPQPPVSASSLPSQPFQGPGFGGALRKF